MVVELEAGRSATSVSASSIERSSRGDTVKSRTAPQRGADQVVVVLGEVLGQLVAGPLVGGDDLLDDAGPLEHRQVAVDGALGEVARRRSRISGMVSGSADSDSTCTSWRRLSV